LCQHYAKKSVQKTDVQTTTTRVITAVIGMIYEYLDRNYSCLEALNILCTKWDKEYVNEKRLPIITKSCSVLVSTQDMVSPDDIRPTDGLGVWKRRKTETKKFCMTFVDKTLVEVEVTAALMHIEYENKRFRQLKRNEFLISDIDGTPEQVKALDYLLHRRIFLFLAPDINQLKLVEEPANVESIDFGHHPTNPYEFQIRESNLIETVYNEMLHLAPSWRSLDPKQPVVVREILASERTFLAWVRTSLSLMTLGIAIIRLFSNGKYDKVAHVTGFIFIATAAFSVFYAWIRGLLLVRQIERSKFFVDTAGLWYFMMVVIIAAVFAAFLAYMDQYNV